MIAAILATYWAVTTSSPEEKRAVDVNAAHNVDTVKVDVGSTMDQGPSDESFRAGNVGVWIK